MTENNNNFISNNDHIGRYCTYGKLSEISGCPSGLAFRLRPVDNNGLSVNWLEFYKEPSRTEQIKKIKPGLLKVMNNNKPADKRMKNLPKLAKIAVLNIGAMTSHVFNRNGPQLTVRLTNPNATINQSHCRIETIPDDCDLVADLIAQKVIETYPARIGDNSGPKICP